MYKRQVVDSADEVLLITTPDDVCMRDVEKTAAVLAAKKAPRPWLIVNRLMPELVAAGEMYSAQAVSYTHLLLGGRLVRHRNGDYAAEHYVF